MESLILNQNMYFHNFFLSNDFDACKKQNEPVSYYQFDVCRTFVMNFILLHELREHIWDWSRFGGFKEMHGFAGSYTRFI
jgi:hypothetical protein